MIPWKVAILGALLAFQASNTRADERHFSLQIEKGALLGEKTLLVAQSDEVTIVFQSDQAIGLHLHGYDLRWEIAASEALSLSFVAEYSGRFPVEAHGLSNHTAEPLFYLEVYPQ